MTEPTQAIDTQLVLDTLRRHSSLEQVERFLRSHNLPHSIKSWDHLITEKLPAFFEEGQLLVEDVAAFAATTEEYGKQHVFLFAPAKKGGHKKYLDRKQTEASVSETGLCLNTPSEYGEVPDTSRVCEVRLSTETKTGGVTIKIIEPLLQQERLGSRAGENGRIIVEYAEYHVRAVNVVRLWPNGCLEVRLYTHSEKEAYGGRETRGKHLPYNVRLAQVWSLISGIIAKDDWEEISLINLREQLWDPNEHSKFEGVFAVRSSDLRNNHGSRLTMAAEPIDMSVFEDKSVRQVAKEFRKPSTNDPTCERVLIAGLVPVKKGDPARSINLVLAGDDNEFVVTSKADPLDYNTVLNNILRFSSS